MDKKTLLTYLGFKFNKGGTHTSRTIMLDELQLLLSFICDKDASRDVYTQAIIEDNCLAKRSVQNRKLTAAYLVELYGLDPDMIVFRGFRYFWERDEGARPLLALLCAYTRDSLLRLSMPFIFNHLEGETVSREHLEEYIERYYPGRFSKNTLSSVAQNLNSSWTKSGHLRGRAKKIRTKVIATPGTTAYALFLSYLGGGRGQALLSTEYMRLLDSSSGALMEQAGLASRRGWITCNHIADVLEVQFPNLLNSKESGWINEQTRSFAE